MPGKAREQAFDAFVAAHLAGLRRTAYLMVGDWTRADQVIERSLADLYRDHVDLTDAQASLTRARTLLIAQVSHAHRLTLDGADLVDSGGPGANPEERLMAALDQVPVQERAAVVLARFNHLDDAEISTILDADARELVLEALAHLRRVLARTGDTLVLEEEVAADNEAFKRPGA